MSQNTNHTRIACDSCSPRRPLWAGTQIRTLMLWLQMTEGGVVRFHQ